MFRLVSPIISIVLALAIFFFLARPMFNDIKSIQDETTQYTEAVDKAAQFNNELQSLITKRNSFSALELQRLDSLVPYQVDEVRALVDLKALAEQHGMLFGNISVKKTPAKGASGNTQSGPAGSGFSESEFETADISFGVIGTYEQLQAFLSDVERSLVLMDITNLKFDATQGDLVQYNFTVRLHALNSNLGG